MNDGAARALHFIGFGDQVVHINLFCVHQFAITQQHSESFDFRLGAHAVDIGKAAACLRRHAGRTF
jgi:hypothetical protein